MVIPFRRGDKDYLLVKELLCFHFDGTKLKLKDVLDHGFRECQGKPKINYVTVFERPGLHEFLKELSEFADLAMQDLLLTKLMSEIGLAREFPSAFNNYHAKTLALCFSFPVYSYARDSDPALFYVLNVTPKST
ncbi:hypothetical protein HAX54_049010 [Datura stramonium]|uniref:Uncharacterized protein n=1 Tax=Datura stramonium TaxID=4076 RepID=A0ABS8SUR0_DATST|nr:hypothetical protein [Datura stramonium]